MFRFNFDHCSPWLNCSSRNHLPRSYTKEMRSLDEQSPPVSHILEASKARTSAFEFTEKTGDNFAQWEGAGHDGTG
jgi:hypothetical protein